MRAVTPEEYDRAVAAVPHACPLAFTGDHRSGHLLLADAAADAARSLAAVASGAAGRAALNALAALVEAAAPPPGGLGAGCQSGHER